METKKRTCLLLAVLLSLSGVLPAAADTSDWLPLAVGNSWTYEHDFLDYKSAFYLEWLSYPTVEFTLSVLRTEVIDGHTYFVISDMPEGWLPPVPRQFIAGKKMRWAGDHLMERTADGEQALFRFDAASGTNGEASYSVTIQGETIQVTARERLYDFPLYNFIFSGGAGPVRVYNYDAIDYLDLDATGELVRPMPNFGPVLTFLKGFGVEVCVIAHHDDDVTLFSNYQEAKHAEINGRTVTRREARDASAAQLKASDATRTESNSWGAIKQEESK